MFKKENRLVPGISFSGSKFINTPQLSLKEKQNGLGLNRFGIVVSKRVDKKAVVRNDIKRMLRVGLWKLNKKIGSGHDILLVVKKDILNKTKEENLLNLEKALERIGLIKK